MAPQRYASGSHTIPGMSSRTPSLLAIETSSLAGSVALMIRGEVRELRSPDKVSHSAWILPTIQQLLAEASVSLQQLDAIAYGAGPGAFTGLRLACGIAQGLSLGAELPLIGVGSLEALALSANAPRVLVAVDARMNEIYTACYAVHDAAVQELVAPVCVPPESLTAPDGRDWAGCGSAFAVYGELLTARIGGCLRSVDAAAVPRAADVARLAAPRVARGETLDAALAAPLYVRDKIALTTSERIARGGKA